MSLGTPLARAGATDRLKQRKSLENGSKMPPRRLQNRSQIASKWLPEASRSPPKSGNASGHLFCSFSWPLGRLLGCSWGASGGSWGRLGASWAAPGPSRGAPGGHLGLPGSSFSSFLGLFSAPLKKHEKTTVRSISRELFVVSFVWRVLCLAGHGGARARLEKHENIWFYSVRRLSAVCAQSENNEEQ